MDWDDNKRRSCWIARRTLPFRNASPLEIPNSGPLPAVSIYLCVHPFIRTSASLPMWIHQLRDKLVEPNRRTNAKLASVSFRRSIWTRLAGLSMEPPAGPHGPGALMSGVPNVGITIWDMGKTDVKMAATATPCLVESSPTQKCYSIAICRCPKRRIYTSGYDVLWNATWWSFSQSGPSGSPPEAVFVTKNEHVEAQIEMLEYNNYTSQTKIYCI